MATVHLISLYLLNINIDNKFREGHALMCIFIDFIKLFGLKRLSEANFP